MVSCMYYKFQGAERKSQTMEQTMGSYLWAVLKRPFSFASDQLVG